MVQAASRRPVTAEARIHGQDSPYGICGEQSSTETGFSSSCSVLPCQYHPTVALHLYHLEDEH
jgi:hypothetical protein